MNVDYVPVADPASEAEHRARILTIAARQRASAEAHAARLAQRKAEKDAIDRAALTAAVERVLHHLEEHAPPKGTHPTARTKTDAARGVQGILSRIAADFEVSVSDIIGPSRTQRIINARFAAIYAIREANPHFGLARIGQCVGRCDHTSVLNALRKMERVGVPQPPPVPTERGQRKIPQPRDDSGRFACRPPKAQSALTAPSSHEGAAA